MAIITLQLELRHNFSHHWVLVLYVIGVTYSLTSTPSYRIFEKLLSWQVYLLSEFLPGISEEVSFFIFRFTSTKATLYLLDHGDFSCTNKYYLLNPKIYMPVTMPNLVRSKTQCKSLCSIWFDKRSCIIHKMLIFPIVLQIWEETYYLLRIKLD